VEIRKKTAKIPAFPEPGHPIVWLMPPVSGGFSRARRGTGRGKANNPQ